MVKHAIALATIDTAGDDIDYWNAQKAHYFSGDQYFHNRIDEGGVLWVIRSDENDSNTLMMRLKDCKIIELARGKRRYGVIGDPDTSVSYPKDQQNIEQELLQFSFVDKEKLTQKSKYNSCNQTPRNLDDKDILWLEEYEKSLTKYHTFLNYNPEDNLQIELAVNPEFIDRQEDIVQDEILKDKYLDETEKATLVKARRGQGIFRSNVFNYESECRVTGLKNRKFLIASHIKPWRKCVSPQERLDGQNGLVLAPHVDKLFDGGFISFENDGHVLVSSELDEETLSNLGLAEIQQSKYGKFRGKQEQYLNYHREEVFIDNRRKT